MMITTVPSAQLADLKAILSALNLLAEVSDAAKLAKAVGDIGVARKAAEDAFAKSEDKERRLAESARGLEGQRVAAEQAANEAAQARLDANTSLAALAAERQVLAEERQALADAQRAFESRRRESEEQCRTMSAQALQAIEDANKARASANSAQASAEAAEATAEAAQAAYKEKRAALIAAVGS